LMKVGLRYVPPIFYVGTRFAITAVLVLLLMKAAGMRLDVPKRARWRLTVVTIMFFAQQGAIFIALTYTTAGRLGVLLNIQPIVTAVLAHWFVAHDRLTWGKVAGLLMAISGIFFIFRESFAETNGLMWIGDTLALLAAITWGAQTIITKHLVKDIKPAAVITWSAAVASLLFMVISLFCEKGPLPIQPWDLRFFGATTYIILVSTVFGFVAWVYLIERNPPSRVTSFCFITPIASLFFGWLILGETVSSDIILATGLVGAGIFVANHQFRRRQLEPDNAAAGIGGE
ncbi:MAG TPA: DMT family transporter, partial [Armatimonadota bacterium]|nr:DMT family transporter [Armatimonadota bacterium]